MSTPLEKFQLLLRELFQFEHADLDFGVYRIMNLRRERTERWLNDELPARAREILRQGGSTADDDLGNRLEAVRAQVLEMDPGGIDEDGNIVNEALKRIAKGKEYMKLKAEHDRAPARAAANLEPLVYNHLYEFFSRYYEAGDFIPKRRRSFAPDGRDTYAIPWDGEEVVLHWANKDQYYIKTGERFTYYRWQSNVGDRTFTIEFRLTDADLPSNNNKDAKKKFHLLLKDKIEWSEETATLTMPFHYRGLTPQEEAQFTGTQEVRLRENIIRRTVEALREFAEASGIQHLSTALMAPKRDAAGFEKRDKDGNAVALLPHHLNRWAVKNESDFFIHKDLRRFLSGELDYFLKSVVLNLDNLLAAGEQRAEPNFRLLDAVKRLGTEIVDFVAQLEDFQKSLFEKKKFILETSWCLTLDRIPEGMREETFSAILTNDRQWEEWESLYKFSRWPSELVTVEPRTREFLDTYPFLMLDTALKNADGSLSYDPTLLDNILASIEGIDDQTDGLIIQSENFHALGLLEDRFSALIQGVYIDPPYNTESSKIIYKNTFEHSSWITLIANRVALSKKLLSPEGLYCIAIDDYELTPLRLLADQIFGRDNFEAVVPVRTKPQGRAVPAGFSTNHDYLVFYRLSDRAKVGRLPRRGRTAERYSENDNDGIFTWANFRKTGGASQRSERPRLFYPIYVSENGEVRVPRLEWLPQERHWVAMEQPTLHEREVLPIDDSGRERVWSWSWARAITALDQLRADISNPTIQILRKYRPNQSGALPGTWWELAEYSASESGTKVLDAILGNDHPFTYPKSLPAVEDSLRVLSLGEDSIALDFFGGSGTTGHAVINLNRADEGSRKYVLIEMGEYFDTVLKPRLQKVVFSESWKDGTPIRQANPKDASNPHNGVSHCMKLLRLETYEDALDNIEFAAATVGAEMGLDFRRDYELRYALSWESKDCLTRLAVEQLDIPFDYTLTLRRESGTATVKPDLPETFAYLIGLHTRRRLRIDRDGVSYLICTGTLHEDGTETAVLWRTCRAWTEADLKAEMDWWREQCETLAPGATRIYVNGASAIEGHHSLDAEFKSRMHGGAV